MIRTIAALMTLAVTFAIPARADEPCVSLDSLTEQIVAKERHYTILTDAGAIAAAISLYNSVDGVQIARADTVILIDLPDGFIYLAVAVDGNACWGLRIGSSHAAMVRKLIMGQVS